MSVASAIAARCPAPEWTTLFEVGNGTGAHQRTRADAVAVNTWPSRGLAIHGFEIKVSRGDWLRELRDPAKSAPVQKYCDRWWVAVSDAKIVRPGELPATWGLLVLKSDRLLTLHEAPPLTPEPVAREFVCSLLRSASEGVVKRSIVEDLVRKRLGARLEDAVASTKMDVQRLERELAESSALWDQLREIVGPSILYELSHKYRTAEDRSRFQRAIRYAAEGGLDGSRAHARSLASRLRDVAREIDAAYREAGEGRPPTHECDRCGWRGVPEPDENRGQRIGAARCVEVVAFVPCGGRLFEIVP